MSSSDVKSKSFLQPIDRVAIVLMLVLSVLIGLLLWQGDRTVPRVRDFSWQGKQVGAEEKSFIVTFTRPMDRASVEKNLRIEPPLEGKISWAGRRMAYTLERPAPYGNSYELLLQGAQERYSRNTGKGAQIQPFTGKFRSRDRAFVYLGVTGTEAGKLILVNLSQQQQAIALTPPDLMVMDFKPYPAGDRILFSAQERSKTQQNAFDAQLYTVTTGIHPNSPGDSSSSSEAPGKIDRVLDSKDYQNLKFDLSPDGKTIVVQRVSRRNPGSDFGLWVIQPPAEARRLESQPGGEFVIHPDGNSLAIAQGQGIAILPLQPEGKSQIKPLDFLPKFGRLLSFSQDGSAAAMVQFNQDYTRSLFLVTNQGVQKELLRTTGSIISAQFDPLKQTLYCLLTQLVTNTKEYREEPYIAAIDLETGKQTPLVLLPKQRDVQISVATDGLAILFDQIVIDRQNQTLGISPRTDAGETITTSNLWLLPVMPLSEDADSKIQPEQLPFAGLRPRWLP